jgi:hypothetical protein
MNTGYGRYGAAYNMIGFRCFKEELSLLPKNPTEAKLQATSTRGESTEPTEGVMKHTYKVVLYKYCLMQYCCILFYQLVSREGCNPNQREKVSKSMDSWQDLHDDDKTCMQSSYWELVLENGQW